MRILIVEDEFNLADAMASRLRMEDYEVDISTNGEDGLYCATSNSYDLLLLDITYPEMDTFQILKTVREKDLPCKVIILTSRSVMMEKLPQLERGANDYLTGPYHLDELVARVNVQLQHGGTYESTEILQFGNVELRTSRSMLFCKDTRLSVKLVRKEFQLLDYFMHHPTQILSEEELYDRVWGIENELESNDLEVFLAFISRKLKAIGANFVISPVRNLGYKMEVTNEQTQK